MSHIKIRSNLMSEANNWTSNIKVAELVSSCPMPRNQLRAQENSFFSENNRSKFSIADLIASNFVIPSDVGLSGNTSFSNCTTKLSNLGLFCFSVSKTRSTDASQQRCVLSAKGPRKLAGMRGVSPSKKVFTNCCAIFHPDIVYLRGDVGSWSWCSV